jgi:hypothetical protein
VRHVRGSPVHFRTVPTARDKRIGCSAWSQHSMISAANSRGDDVNAFCAGFAHRYLFRGGPRVCASGFSTNW